MDYEESILRTVFRGPDRWFLSIMALLVSVYWAAHVGEIGSGLRGLAALGGASFLEMLTLYYVLWVATLIDAGGIAGYSAFWITFWTFALLFTILALYHHDQWYGLLSAPVALIVSLAIPLLIIAWAIPSSGVSMQELGLSGPDMGNGAALEGVGYVLKFVLLLCLCFVLAGVLSYVTCSVVFVLSGIDNPPFYRLPETILGSLGSASSSASPAQPGRYYRGRGFCPLCGHFYTKAMPKVCVACKHDLVMVGSETSCSQCGSPVYATERFCRYCGANLLHQADSPVSEAGAASITSSASRAEPVPDQRPSHVLSPAESSTAVTAVIPQPPAQSDGVAISPSQNARAPEPPLERASSPSRQQEARLPGSKTTPPFAPTAQGMRLFCRRCGMVHLHTQQGQLCLQCRAPVTLPSLKERDTQCKSCGAWVATFDLCCWQCGARL